MSDLDRESKLKDEIQRGSRASAAYSSFFQEYIETKRQALHSALGVSTEISELSLVRINTVLFILNDLEAEILSNIETAKLASIELERQDQ